MKTEVLLDRIVSHATHPTRALWPMALKGPGRIAQGLRPGLFYDAPMGLFGIGIVVGIVIGIELFAT